MAKNDGIKNSGKLIFSKQKDNQFRKLPMILMSIIWLALFYGFLIHGSPISGYSLFDIALITLLLFSIFVFGVFMFGSAFLNESFNIYEKGLTAQLNVFVAPFKHEGEFVPLKNIEVFIEIKNGVIIYLKNEGSVKYTDSRPLVRNFLIEFLIRKNIKEETTLR